MAAAGLCFHSFLDGVAIGISFQANAKIGLLIALVIIAHDFSDGLNTVTVVLAHGNPVRRSVAWLLVDMAAPGDRRGQHASHRVPTGRFAVGTCVLLRLPSVHRCF